ncbi:probable transcription factor At3g04930 [Euphorbia lathyris]|uniref:probable transcription factor At3g04930 n=1 Tax=Euphorbia lathyris TaxID=212925 RepID=UPI003313B8F5
MASEQHDTVFDHDLDDDDESSQSQDDDDDLDNDDVMVENDDVLADEEDEEDLNSVSPSTSSPVTVPIAVPSASVVTIAVPNGVNLNPPVSASMDSTPDPKRQRFETTLVIHQPEEKKPLPPPPPPPQQIDESRRLFQRLWTDEDEIELLQGFHDYTTQRGSNHHDTALFYDQIKSKLQLDFNKNQLVEKLRRLKKKYRNVLAKISSGKEFSFKTVHDQATFEISRKIWSSTGKLCGEDGNLDDEDGNPNPNQPNFVEAEVKIEDPKSTPRSRKRARPRSATAAASGVKLEDKRLPNEPQPLPQPQSQPPVPTTEINNNTNAVHNNSPNVPGLIEETIRSCLSPLLKELLNNAMASGSCNSRGIGGLAMNAMPLNFGGGEMMVDEKWRKQQILELEVYSRRLELVQDQIRAQLEELRSMGA